MFNNNQLLNNYNDPFRNRQNRRVEYGAKEIFVETQDTRKSVLDNICMKNDQQPAGDNFKVNLPLKPRTGDRFFRPQRQYHTIDKKEFQDMPEKGGDLAGDRLNMISNEVKVENRQREMEKFKKSVIKEEEKPFESAANDIRGENRNWNNWVIKTFRPLEASSFGTGPTFIKLAPGLPPKAPEQPDAPVDQKYDSIRFNCNKNSTAFRDPEFPQELSSILGFYENTPRARGRPNILTKNWQRPGKIFDGGKYFMYDKTIEPSDIIQGELGDCYFLSALASLAQNNERIKRLIRFRRTTETGVYCFSFCINGIWENIVVDDKIPCLPDHNKPVFCQSKTSEVWPILMEKAWAKIHGGYLNVESGRLEEALKALSGAPCSLHMIADDKLEENQWVELLDARRRSYVFACSTKDFAERYLDKKGVDPKTGLVASHGYSILGIYELVRQPDGSFRRLSSTDAPSPANLRLIKIRNPWSSVEWQGDFSDKSPYWTPQLKKELGQSEQEDGIFFITSRDFAKHFSSFVICKYIEGHLFSGNRFVGHPTEPSIFQFTLPQEGRWFFCLNQISKRFFRDEDEYVYSTLTMLVARITSKNTLEVIGCCHGMEEDMHIEAKCPKGNYVVYICTPWRRKVNQFGFSLYGPALVDKVLSLKEEGLLQNFVIKYMFEKAAKATGSEWKNFANIGMPEIGYTSEVSNTGLGYVLFENKSKDVQVTATITFSSPQNTVFYPPVREDRIELVVMPGKKKLIAFRMTNPESSFSYSQSVSFESNYSKHFSIIKSEGQKFTRLKDGADVGVYLYVLKYKTGFGYLYENTSKNFELDESIELSMTNCKLAGDSNEICVQLRPGKSRMIMMTAVDKNRSFKAEVDSCVYELTRTDANPNHFNSMLAA